MAIKGMLGELMTENSVQGVTAARGWKRVQKFVSGGAAVALVSGMLVVAGLGVQSAIAAPPAPTVTTAPANPPLVAGEEGAVDVTFRNSAGSVGPFNLSATLLLPEGVKVTAHGALGAPTKIYTNADGALPGAYSASLDCEAMGLITGPTPGKCQVPAGSQLFVFENISDLPATAANRTSVTLLPDADLFEPGSSVPYVFTGFTSDNANLIPVFPGSSSKAASDAHTSAPGIGGSQVAVEALRVAKSEPSPENELLRGVHDHQTVYTLRISHTGEGDITNAKVVDYLPAGLEYLGSGQLDHTTQANGNGSTEEYGTSGTMAALTPQPARWIPEESIVTVRGGFDSDGNFVADPAGAVFTRVTWDLGTLLAQDGIAQNFGDGVAGTSGVVELQYVAGIPLFENSYIEGVFDEQTNGPHGVHDQGANLDNNTGPSTRHGEASNPSDSGEDLTQWRPNGLTNTSVVSGDYTLKHPVDPEDAVYTSSASGSHTVEAVDVRLLKDVDNSQFTQGGLATYSLTVSTSEYVTAELAENAGPSSNVRPNRLVDDLADGICPVFPPTVPVTPGASTQPDEIPNLRIGNPNAGIPAGDSNLTAAEWSSRLGAASTCKYPSDAAGAALSGATLTGVAYDPASGHFFLDLWIDELGRSDNRVVSYTALQNTSYTENDGKPGATSSGDRVSNTAEILMTTSPTDLTAAVENSNGTGVGGEFRAAEDSQEYLDAPEGGLKKYVLPRAEGAQTAASITGSALAWEDEKAPEPFAAGDEVWYKISLIAPGKADVRNPQLSDYLPVGVELPAGWPNAVDSSDLSLGYTDYVITPPTVLKDYGTCSLDPAADEADWLERYIGNAGGAPTVDGNLLTWSLGSDQCVTGNTADRFLPIDSPITVYIKGIVTDTSAAATQDLPQNLAKYQQQGRIGSQNAMEIFFLRDSAEIELVTTPELIKGIEKNEFAGITGFATTGADPWRGVAPGPNYPAGSNHDGSGPDNGFWSDVDGEYAVQKDGITFRIDVKAPTGNANGSVATKDYVVWDALPQGVKAADVKTNPSEYRATQVNIAWTNIAAPGAPENWVQALSETDIPAGNIDFSVVDPGDPGYPAAGTLNTDYQGRSLILWKVKNTSIPGSKAADPADPHAEVISGFSLHYTVVAPSDASGGANRRDALLGQQYENTASIVQYDAFTSTSTTGSTTTLVPFGEDTIRNNGTAAAPTLPAGAKPVPQKDTFDDSWFQIPEPAMKKTLVATEIKGDNTTTPNDPNNPDNVIVQGEYATYDLSVVIPANTTVRDGVLFDNGTLVGQTGNGTMQPNTADYQVKSADLVNGSGNPVVTPSGFTLGTDGTLQFPAYYQTGNSPETFTVRLVVWVKDIDETTKAQTPSADRPQIPNGKVLRNTAQFDSKNISGSQNGRISDTADVTYREPNLAITKNASPNTNIAIGTNIVYTIAVQNTGNRVASYDNIVVDTVPSGLLVNENSFKIGTTTSYTAATSVAITAGALAGDEAQFAAGTVTDGAGGTITWSFERTNALKQVPNTVYLFYTAQIDPQTGGGQSFTNTAKVTGQTLPSTLPDADDRRGDRVSSASRAVTATTASIVKNVRVKPADASNPPYSDPVSAPIGQTVQYKVDVGLNAFINYYEIEVRDALAAGVELQPGTVKVEMKTGEAPAVDVTSDWTLSGTDPTRVWKYTKSGAGGDLASDPEPRTLTFTYDVLLKNLGVAQNTNSLTNTAGVTWAITNGGALRTPITDTAGVTVLNPIVGIQKKVDTVDAITRNPDASFEYTVTARNTGTAAGNLTPAHNLTVQDVVPAGVKVDTTQAGLAGATFSNAANLANGLGGTITWTNVGPLYPAAQAGAGKPNAQTFTYTGTFANSETLTAAALENAANVTRFESFGTGGRVYTAPVTGAGSIRDTASVAPLFPSVVPVKSVTNRVAGKNYGLAYVDTAFNWTLTVTNSGAGVAKDISVTDTLPKNWEYAGNAMISVDGGPAVPLATAPTLTPSTVAEGDQQVITWNQSAIRTAGATQLAAGKAFVITFDARPLAAATSDAGTGVEVHPHRNTLSVTATDTQDRTRNAAVTNYAGASSTADAYIAEADLKLVKTAIGGVTSTVPANHPLSGVAAGSWVVGQAPEAGVYVQPQWQLTIDNHGPNVASGPFTVTETPVPLAGVTLGVWNAYYVNAAGTETFLQSFSGTGPFIVGDNNSTLQPNGSDKIVLRANVNIGTSATPGSMVQNTASVEGRTFEPDAKKGPDADNPNTSTAEKPLTESADLQVTKTVSATPNAGGAISWSITPRNNGPSVSRSTAANPITIADTIPAGVNGVADPSTSMWTATTPGGFPADAGATITFALNASYTSLPVGAQTAISLSGTVDPAWTPTSGPQSDGSIRNTAVIAPGTGLTPDPKTPNNTSMVPTTPTFNTTLGISKDRVVKQGGAWVLAASLTPVPEVQAGDPVHYLVTVANNGAAVARNVTVVDEVPTGLTYTGFENVSPATWSRTAHATVPWDLFSLTSDGSTLPVGGSRSFVVEYATSPSTPATVNNCVQAGSSQNSSQPRDCEGFASDRVSDLSLTKDVITEPGGAALPDGAGVLSGNVVTYRLLVTNEGPSDALGAISVTDSLPANFTYVDDSATVNGTAAAPVRSGQDLTWEVLPSTGTLPVASGSNTITIEFQATIASTHAAATGIANEATVTGQNDPNPSNDTDDAKVNITTEANMSIAKTVESGPWYAGNTVTYTLTVSNTGPSVAESAHVVDALPEGLSMVSMSGTDWTCIAPAGSSSGSCDYDGRHPVGTSTITVVARIASDLPNTALTNPFVNEAELTWTDSRTYTDPADDPRHDDDDESITVTTQADLGLVKTAVDPADNTTEITSAVAGQQARYRIDVTNYGPSNAAADLVVTDTLPLGVSYVGPVDATASGWDIDATSYDPTVPQVLTFTRIAGGTKIGLPMVGTDPTSAPMILIDVLLDPSLEPTDPPTVPALVNTAVVTSATPEPAVDPHPNSDDAPLNVTRSADLEITKSHPVADPRDRVFVGDPLPFTIDVTNHGTSVSSGFTITDTMPVGFEVTSVVGPVLDGNGDPTGWTIDSIAPDPWDETQTTAVVASYSGITEVGANSPSLVIDTIVHQSAFSDTAAVVNHVGITSANEPDPDPTNNEFEDPVKVRPVVTLVVEKQAVGEFKVGKLGTYSITVENRGPHPDHGPITVTDALPAGLSFSSSPKLPDGATVTHDAGLVTWTLTEPLGVGEKVELQLVVHVLQAAYDQPNHEITNTAVVDSESDLTSDSVLTDSATITVKPVDPLVNTGAEIGGGILAALALLLLLGGGTYLAGRRRQQARHG